MPYVKQCTNIPEFEQEVLYQLGELRYHLDQIRVSLWEAVYHLQKSREHDSLLNEASNKFALDLTQKKQTTGNKNP